MATECKLKESASQLAKGGMLEAGTANEFNTGDWRSIRPVWQQDKCINCLICWISCPDSSVKVSDGKMTGFDLAHCKGCGICAKECPVKGKAIVMEEEKK